MILFLLAYLGGVLTIVSPCILPVLPFVFARADRPFRSSGLPMLLGMAATFALVATLSAVGGGWAVKANAVGRDAALLLLAAFGLALLLPGLADRMTQPLVGLGSRLSEAADRRAGEGGSAVGPSLLLGVATGLLWAPCAGPVLGLILTGAALGGASLGTTVLLAAYAAGAATSLALALLVGGRVFRAMKRFLGVGQWVRRGLGAAVLVAVAVIGLGLDRSVLTPVSLASTGGLEQGLIDRLRPGASAARSPSGAALDDEGAAPSFAGANTWINTPPLTEAQLRGHVVLVDFWTYSCINCLRAIPYTRAWAGKYRDQGLIVIGVHAPEFAFEKNVDNVRRATRDLRIGYPVAVDNDYAIWRGFHNEYWPALFLVDAKGRIRHHHFGEGDDVGSERAIRALLAEAGQRDLPGGLVDVHATGAQAAADRGDIDSPETYLGTLRAQNFVSPGGARPDIAADYLAGAPQLNQWSLLGNWTVGPEDAALNKPGGGITYRFHARDLHLVLGLAPGAAPTPFRVTIDGQPPGPSHGADTDAAGGGTVDSHRLYQLVRQDGAVADHTFEIRFDTPGVQAYAFTFG